MRVTSILLLLFVLLQPVQAVQAAPAVVHAILFYSPACGHCHMVIEQVLPPLFEQYGDQLVVIGIDVTQPEGQQLFMGALQKFNMESSGVPLLVVGDSYLIGSRDIPEKFPGLIESGLAAGGIAWPDIPGLQQVLEQELSTEQGPQSLTTDTSQASWERKFARDPLGNSLAVLVLLGMVAALGWTVRTFRTPATNLPNEFFKWGIPLASLLGLIVAGYLAYVETLNVTAICGPVGDCNTVQQSEYAQLFGILPLGVLGVFGYLAIGLTWAIGQFAQGRLALVGRLVLFGCALFGLLASIYLTFLEPFVIGATCAWCLASAILITLILLFSVPGGRDSLQELTSRV